MSFSPTSFGEVVNSVGLESRSDRVLSRLLFLLLILSSSFVFNPSCFAQEAIGAEPYVRVTKDDAGRPIALETALVSFEGAKHADTRVDLIAAVHIADRSYYAQLNKMFADYDVVLFELVVPDDFHAGLLKDTSRKSGLSSLQASFARLLDLSLQIEEVDYSARNFVHADLTYSEFKESMERLDESPISILIKMFAVSLEASQGTAREGLDIELAMALLERDPVNKAKRIKVIVGKEFGNVDTLIQAISGNQSSTLITARNDRAIDVLKQQIKAGRKKIAIFYGGGHMPDLAAKLSDKMSMHKSGSRWLQAWDLRYTHHK